MTDFKMPVPMKRSGISGMILLLLTVFVTVMAALSLLPREMAAGLAVWCLALFAVVGLLALYAYACGWLRIAGLKPDLHLSRLICDESTDGLVVTDVEGSLLYGNAAYEALVGPLDLWRGPAVERRFADVPEIREAIYRLAQAGRQGRAGLEELRLSPALMGGAPFGWYRIAVRPLFLKEARPATLWRFTDITREREQQEKLFGEWRRAIAFLDQAPAGFFSSDRDGRITFLNATLATWLDYDVTPRETEEIALFQLDGRETRSGGLALGDLMAGDGANVLGAKKGAPGEVRCEQLDLDLKRREGRSLPVRLLHRIAFGEDGRPETSCTLVLNRAANEEPAEGLRGNETRFARVFDTTPIAMAIVDRSGQLLRSNAAFARFMPEALDRNGKNPPRALQASIIEPDRAGLDEAIQAAARSGGDIPPVDVTFVGAEERSARLFVASANEGQGGAMIYALDTTELRTLQNNFAQSQKMQAIGQLAGGVAHDFNNVLTAIIGYSDLLLANQRPTDPSFQDIMQIKQNANRAAGLVRQLLAFSRRQTLRPQVLQLGDVLSDLQMLLRRLVGETIELDLRHGRDLWLVKADLNQFEQVIVNLVVNARDAMPDGGRIALRTRNIEPEACAAFSEKTVRPAEYVLIEVEDNGQGIPIDVKDKIFEPFFTTKEVGKGTGLGLAMVYGIVKQTGGTVFCDSVLGVGTTFSILLPRYKEEHSAEAPVVEAPKPAADLTGRGTILLVEDEEAVRAFGARALTSRGYTVLQAGSGLEALEVVEQNEGKIDLVVSDVVMPEMDGPTMFGELRKRGVMAKVIFVSGYAEEAFAKNLPEGQEFAFLPKPFSLKQLIEAVKGQTT
ncbi:cell cycle histidine kinase CckA [Beijerinckia indica]|uniref:histidine kinase n=1 Tax=Beijerinckia indica subsp. indica (strain ATCC 9039 / DSM 1715 / NCIMB 8712) TaxID=395963 RepID=B2IF41_BEII9|nr:ATP-binding protein [Beijerinckia indica]ACB95606.1 multi-sensor hybrid histidine kinase [Beijerinckia indica subsp. indica ATCC 9039]